MAQRPKLTAQRQDRLVAIVGLGESLEAACRALEVSSTAVRKRMARDGAFAERVRVAREHRQAVGVAGHALDDQDWRAAAAQLEVKAPERWALPRPQATPRDRASR